MLVFGATGMVGQGVLRECLLDPEVELAVTVGRTATGTQDAKLWEIVRGDLQSYAGIEDELAGFDACFFCLGVSSGGMKEADYERVTYGLTLAAAETLSRVNPEMTFIYVSGAGARDVGAGEGAHGECAAAIAAQGLYVSSGADRAAGWYQVEDTGVPDSLWVGQAAASAAAMGVSEPGGDHAGDRAGNAGGGEARVCEADHGDQRYSGCSWPVVPDEGPVEALQEAIHSHIPT